MILKTKTCKTRVKEKNKTKIYTDESILISTPLVTLTTSY